MQSRLPATDPNSAEPPSFTSGHASTHQHGESPAQLGSSRSSSPRAATDRSSQPNGYASEASAASTTPVPVHAASRLSPAPSPSPLNRNRIAEYENTPLTPKPRKRAGGPAFDVVKKTGASREGACQLLDLPNEILTHTFANLSPADLTSVSLASKRLHSLVTTQHAWRAAFSRFFPGPESMRLTFGDEDLEEDHDTLVVSKRDFTRLTALASWRSEYILRTRLLRSLSRGKPVQSSVQPAAARSAQSHTASPILLYNSGLFTTINHLHASFGIGLNKRLPQFIHGADDIGMASVSDPSSGKVQNWGLADPTTLHQFTDRFLGDALYGLGPGQIVGVPNPMDVSTPYGMVSAEGYPGGNIYFRFTEEMRGRYLAVSSGAPMHDLGIPKVQAAKESQCCVWIAKNSSIPSMTDGMIGLLSGSSLGVLSSYSLGSLSARDQRYSRGEMTARWVICPGVPILAIAVDDNYSYNRLGQNRVWAVVLNALGEVYYLTKFPTRHTGLSAHARPDPLQSERVAWQSGRSVFWNLVEPTRRSARPDPYGESAVDGSYTPRSSWTGMCLSKEQVQAESREIESYLVKKPVDFQAMCFGWDMRRQLVVDFANDDGNHAGETIVVIDTGLDENTTSSIDRYSRIRPLHDDLTESPSVTSLSAGSNDAPQKQESLFGGPAPPNDTGTQHETLTHRKTLTANEQSTIVDEEWRRSTMTFGGIKSVQITASSLDCSSFAVSTAQEDPFLSFSGASSASSPSLTPLSTDDTATRSQDVPGQRARLLAIGTSLGTVLVFNIRATAPPTTELVTLIDPVRIIHTESPAISCLALSSLYLVSGGTDGLVQAWDPLASSNSPVRTLHSRFSSRARRRLAQAAASPQGVGINLFAAGAIILDPDPTVLRGLVSLGTHLLYWHFSSSAADAYRSHKRRVRRSERMSNGGGERYVPAPRAGGVKRFIDNEKWELQLEEQREQKETARMAGRFGTDLLGESATEEDMLAYAALLSQEAFERDEERRISVTPSTTTTPAGLNPSRENARTSMSSKSIVAPAAHISDSGAGFDADLEEAIKQSLALSDNPDFQSHHEFQVRDDNDLDFPVKYAKTKKRSPKNSPTLFGQTAEGSSTQEKDDIELALEISLAEERSRLEAEGEERVHNFHDASNDEGFGRSSGKGKGKAGVWQF
ncbi:hypothetical protein K461DRAFT_234548 [Myriangium duriaei CBS 260.36]|uniref:F-box domain-containing protein n=1 Tax=Myriangium duriaei CBS 260.36 TaxID=1168546 RepID=A0A9P4J823_9PEZI|nr:hypothetical protein K461DRAFT_234548 [Myriangium duriaei CBS 260.36]